MKTLIITSIFMICQLLANTQNQINLDSIVKDTVIFKKVTNKPYYSETYTAKDINGMTLTIVQEIPDTMKYFFENRKSIDEITRQIIAWESDITMLHNSLNSAMDEKNKLILRREELKNKILLLKSKYK